MEAKDSAMEDKKKKAYRVGLAVLILLAALTIGEYFVGVTAPLWAGPILAISLIKAFLIVRDYMHIGRVFAGDVEA